MAVALVVGATAGLGPPPADAALVIGACLLKIELTGAVERLPATASFMLSGGGTCVVEDDDFKAPATVSGTLGGVQSLGTVGCLAAALDGTVTLNVTTDGYGSMTGMMTAAVSGAGAAPLVTVTGTTFAAAGLFVQDPLDTVACVSDDGASSLTWLGVLAFANGVV